MKPQLMSSDPDCIIFDLGKTVFDKPYKLSVAIRIIEEFGFSLLNPIKAYYVWMAIADSKEEAKKLTKEGNTSISWDQIFADKYAQSLLGCSTNDFYHKVSQVVRRSVNPYPGMLELIKELHQNGYRLAVLSNSDPITSKAVRESDFFTRCFHTLCLSNETGFKKPAKEAFDDLLHKVQRTAQQCIFFDDKPENIEAAKQEGLHAHLFESAEQVRAQLIEYGLLSSPTHFSKSFPFMDFIDKGSEENIVKLDATLFSVDVQ